MKPADREENDAWFSGKHQSHGAKLQVLSAPDVAVIHFCGIIPDRRNDKYLFDQSDIPRALSQTVTNDNGLQVIVRPPILIDGGYQGIHETYPEATMLHRRSPHGLLTPAQKHENTLISQDRVVVEQFFGILKKSRRIIRHPYRGDRDSIETLAKILVCPTNLKLKTEPLYAEKEPYEPFPERRGARGIKHNIRWVQFVG